MEQGQDVAEVQAAEEDMPSAELVCTIVIICIALESMLVNAYYHPYLFLVMYSLLAVIYFCMPKDADIRAQREREQQPQPQPQPQV